MTGDNADFLARLKSALPARWFPDNTPVLDGLLSGLATAWTILYDQLAAVRAQSRIATASTTQLDAISLDFFAARLPRHAAEPDPAFRRRIIRQLVREHATRGAVVSIIADLTGRAPVIFEPGNLADTGAYATPNLAYGQAGAWGSLTLPFQAFVTVRRQPQQGIANIAGYGTSGPIARANAAISTGQVTDADIYAAVASVLPTATTAWTRITN